MSGRIALASAAFGTVLVVGFEKCQYARYEKRHAKTIDVAKKIHANTRILCVRRPCILLLLLVSIRTYDAPERGMFQPHAFEQK